MAFLDEPLGKYPYQDLRDHLSEKYEPMVKQKLDTTEHTEARELGGSSVAITKKIISWSRIDWKLAKGRSKE